LISALKIRIFMTARLLTLRLRRFYTLWEKVRDKAW